jgi:undecaprenyl phosphate-alpha-L-ara4N flippase subunit ArnE
MSVDDDAPISRPAQRPRKAKMTIGNFLLLLFAVAAAASGQIILKHAMNGVAAQVARDGGSVLVRAATAPLVWAGLVVFGISALAWLSTLARVPLSVAYPFNALGLLVIVGSSALVLHEKVSALAWSGAALVAAGLVIVVLAQQS